jgi:hypothetical protein
MPHGLHGQLAGTDDPASLRRHTPGRRWFGGKAGIHAEYSVVAACRMTKRPSWDPVAATT